MLPNINGRKAFIEVTNMSHGGRGWELGTCLWSPKFSKANAQSWDIMNEISPGDIVLHLVKIKGVYSWFGISIAGSSVSTIEDQPTKPGKWGNMAPYYRVSLLHFNLLENPIPTSHIFKEYKQDLISINESTKYGLFYNFYGGRELRVAYCYLSRAPLSLYEIFNRISNEVNFVFDSQPIETEVPTNNEPLQVDISPPGRTKCTISRIIRDTKLSRETKEENHYRCQICGTTIQLPKGYLYAEGHHLQPLGGNHVGLDVKENIIILCPTHHTEFDYGSISIDPLTNLIQHVDSSNIFHQKRLAYQREDLGVKYLKYHHEKIFG